MQPVIVSVPMGNGMSRGEVIPMPTNVDVNSTRQIPEADDVGLSPEQQADLERRIAKAKSLLVLDHPFFGMAVSKRDLIYDYNVPTASMDGRGQMRLNPTWCFEKTVSELIFLLAHEAMHYMLCHALRCGARDPDAWNVAADLVINDTLIHAGVGTFIKGGLTFDGARNHSTEELYNDPRWVQYGGIGNDIDTREHLSESEAKEIEGQAKVELIQASKAAKAMGKLPANLERMIDEIVHVKTPWYDILERYMSGKVRDGWSWRRPNRRFVHQGIYLPATDYLPKIGDVVVGVDTSGSIGQSELDAFNAHVGRIIDTCNPSTVTVIYCDASVNHVDVFTPEDFPVRLSPHGGGGTSFIPVFDYIDEHQLDPEVVVYLTDGYGDQYDFTSKHETVWLTTGTSEFSWGTVIEFDVNA